MKHNAEYMRGTQGTQERLRSLPFPTGMLNSEHTLGEPPELPELYNLQTAAPREVWGATAAASGQFRGNGQMRSPSKVQMTLSGCSLPPGVRGRMQAQKWFCHNWLLYTFTLCSPSRRSKLPGMLPSRLWRFLGEEAEVDGILVSES